MNNLEKWSQFPGGNEKIYAKTMQKMAYCHLTTVARFTLNNKKRSHTQLDSRKQVIAFQDRVMTINIKEAQHPLK